MIEEIRMAMEGEEGFANTVIFNFDEYKDSYSLDQIRDEMISFCKDFINSVYEEFIADEDA